MFKIRALLGAVIAGSLACGGAAQAQDYPKKQAIKIVVAVPGGGLTDAIARITAEFLQKRLGQAVIVENKPGGSSTIGADYVARSAPDGYTIFLAGAEQPVIAGVRHKMSYQLEDFTYLVRGFTSMPLILVGPKSPFNTTSDLVAYMKANPGKLTYGSTGIGAINHMGTVMFEASAGVKGLNVPYSGIGPVYTGLMAGDVDFTLGGSPGFPDGLKVLGPAGTKRSVTYPNLPSLDELGIKNAGWDLWFGFLAPKNLPKPIADRLTTELLAIIKDPEAVAKYTLVIKSAPDANPLVGEAFKARVLAERATWKSVADREHIVID